MSDAAASGARAPSSRALNPTGATANSALTNLMSATSSRLALTATGATAAAPTPTSRALNPTAVQQSGAAPLTPTPLSTTAANNQPVAINSQPPTVTPYAYSSNGTATGTASPLIPGGGSSTSGIADQNGNPISADQRSLSSTDVQKQQEYQIIYGDGDIPLPPGGLDNPNGIQFESEIILGDGDISYYTSPSDSPVLSEYTPVFGDGASSPSITEDNPYGLPGLPNREDSFHVEFAPDGSSYISGLQVEGGTHAEGDENINIENELNKESSDIKTPTGQFEEANGFLLLEKAEEPLGELPTPEQYREELHSSSRESQDLNYHPDDYYDLYRAINPEYDPDGTGWNDQGSIALAPPQDSIGQAQSELEAGGGSEAVTSLIRDANLLDADLSTPGQPAEPWLQEFQDFQNNLAVTAAEADPRAAFDVGFVNGVALSVETNAVGLAKMALSTAQFAADSSRFGVAGDALRGVTGKLPKWLDAFIPSAERGMETAEHTVQLAENIGAYVTSRAKDPSLFRDDMKQFFSENWDALKDDHAAAAAQGPAAEAEWWGKVTGQAAVEIAMTAVAAADVVRVAKVAGGLAELALEAGAEFTTAKLAEVSSYAKDLTSLASDVSADEMLSLTSYDELQSVQEELFEFQANHSENLSKTSEGQAALDDIMEAQTAVDNALLQADTVKLLSDVDGVVNEAVTLTDEALNDANFADESATRIRVASDNLETIILAGPEAFGEGAEGQAAYDKAVEAQVELQKVEKSLATPYPKGPIEGVADPTVELSVAEQSLLNDLPAVGSSATYGSGILIDEQKLANVTAATGNEFAVFEDSEGSVKVFRGNAHSIDISETEKQSLIKDGYELKYHTQNGYSLNELNASFEDQQLLKDFNQERSIVVNANGDTAEFTQTEERVNVNANINQTLNVSPQEYNQLSSDGELEKNTAYVVRDNNVQTTDGTNFTEYTYVSDSRGDLTRIEGQLKKIEGENLREDPTLQTQIGNEGVQSLPGNEDLPRADRDVGFHVQGHQFGGGINRENIVPGNSKLNGGSRGGWGYLENQLAERLARPADGAANDTIINFSIELEREPGPPNARPSHFVYNYNINGGPEFTNRYANTTPIPGVTGTPYIPPGYNDFG
jgi:DNA/RNA non-specific endonuclease